MEVVFISSISTDCYQSPRVQKTCCSVIEAETIVSLTDKNKVMFSSSKCSNTNVLWELR